MNELMKQARLGEPLSGLEIIDMHGHLGRVNFAIPDDDPVGVVRTLDRIGVKSIACSEMRCMTPSMAAVRQGNDFILEAMRTCPGRILGYFSVYPESESAVREETERCLPLGFMGIKLHNSNGYAYDLPAYAPAYEVAHRQHLPVLLHTWGDPPVMQQIGRMARRYPAAIFLLAHTGAGDISANIELIRECPNVYGDLAYSRSPRGMVRQLVDAVGADRIVWGSDMIFFNIAHQIGKVLGADLSTEDRAKILGGNARKILAQHDPPME
jgi:predicted TIM-barrel fold metal-dependent hydrolase